MKATKVNFTRLAKIYLVGLGLLSSYFLSTYLFGLIAPLSQSTPLEQGFGYLPLMLLTIYGFFPIIAALVDHYKLYVATLIIAASRILLATSGILSWEIIIPPIPIALYMFAAFLCLFLAVENVKTKVTVEALSFSSGY